MKTTLPASTPASVRRRVAMGWGIIRLALGLMLLVLAGCTTYQTKPPQMTSRVALLDWLQAGRTTREELEMNWGPSSASLRQGRIVFYRLEGNANGIRFCEEGGNMGRWERCRHSLVLIFNPNGVLEKSSLVRIR